jgi:hypothetical protein
MLLFRNIISVLLVLCFTGCGFSPLYKKHSTNNYDILSDVEIIIQDDNTLNQLVKNHLQTIFTTNGNSRYQLYVQASKFLSAALIQHNSTISRYSVDLSVTYNIKDKLANKDISSNSLSLRGYYGYSSPYATYIAEEYEISNLIREISLQIRNNIMILLSRQEDENKSK